MAKQTKSQSAASLCASRRKRTYRRLCKESKATAFVVTRRADLRYLTGFAGEGLVLLAPGVDLLVPYWFFGEQAAQECSGQPGLVVAEQERNPFEPVAKHLRGKAVRALGVQADELTVLRQTALQKAVGKKTLTPMPDIKSYLRLRKDDGEVKIIRKAVRIAQDALGGMVAQGAGYLIGRTELDIAAELECRMKQLGANDLGFPSIVAAGPNSSRCHHIPSRRKLRKGEGLLIDWGAMVDGYRSDLTRTLFMGKIPPKIAEFYPVVLAANKAAIEAIRPGVTCERLDAIARDIITEAGFGERYGHGLGHGLGLDVHEQPFLGKTNTSRLKAGMVITIEPGIYFPGIGGVRIEDDVLVTPNGYKLLSTFPKELDQVVID